jgi:PKD repeat protein
MGMVRRVYGRSVIAMLAALMLVGATGLVGYDQGLSLLSIRQTIEPQRIFLKGSGANPETATVTLELEAPRRAERIVADVMLVVDRSASFELDQAVSAAQRILDRLGAEDRVGLVSFATEATLDARLTPVTDAQRLRDALAQLTAEGKTALGEGIAVATDELVVSGRTGAALVQILLTDGRSNFGRDPLAEARNAGNRGVVIYAVGIGRFVNRDGLTQIAEETGGRFFPAFNDAIVDQILRVDVPLNEPVARELEIVETLSQGINFEEALENTPTRVTRNSDGTTTLVWQRSSLRAGEVWIIRYTVSGSREGSFALHRFPSYVRFTDFRNREIQRDLPVGVGLVVRPRSALITTAFSFTPANPTAFDQIQFTDRSRVERGRILRWLWEFGDGTTSTEQNPLHQYAVDGQYRVTLTVTGEDGGESSSSSVLTVFTPEVSVRRTIDAFLPVDQTIPGQTFRVTLDVQVNRRLNGMGVDENLPSGWTITPVENSSAQVRVDDTQWLFSEVLEPGTVKKIVYQVTVPLTLQVFQVYRIDGTASSAVPQISLPVRGESEIQVLSGFPIPVVVAHWDVGNQALNLEGFSTHKIDLNQILQATSWWRQGQQVPGSTRDAAGQPSRIDFKTMQELVAYWLTDTSVFEALPKE